MRWFRIVPFVLIGLGLILLTGALRRSGRSPAASPEPPWPELPGSALVVRDAAGEALIHQAVQRFQDPALTWLQAGVWMRARLPGLRYEGEGSYCRAPGSRYRLEIRTRLHGTPARGEGMVLALSDGRDQWQATRIGTGWRDVRRLRLSALDGSDTAAFLKEGNSLMRGPDVVLRVLRDTLHWGRPEPQGRQVLLQGSWKPEILSALRGERRGWSGGQPRVCHLTLDEASLWPARIAWYGPTEENSECNRLLVELEFRSPVLGQILSETECAARFAFHPADAPVLDITPQIQADLSQRQPPGK